MGSALEIAVSGEISANFENHQALCRMYLCEDAVALSDAYQRQIQGTNKSISIASKILLDGLVRDSASAYRWLDLGQVLSQAGSLDQASYCVGRALRLGGDSADVALAAGDFYLRFGDRHKGLHELARTLGSTRAFDQPVFGLFRARGVSVDDALSYAMPEDRLPVQAYLRYVIERREVDHAEKIWKWMTDRRLDDEKIAIEYCSFLFYQHQFSQAAATWTSETALFTPIARSAPAYGGKEYLYNGALAHEPLAGAVFDWKITPTEGASIRRDCQTQPSGCSLQIQFTGLENIDFKNVSQNTVLEPGKYHLRALVRTTEITTDQGVFLEVKDGENEGRLDVESDQLKGSSDWHEIQIPFRVEPATNFINVVIRRKASMRFDSKISGIVWIRDLSLIQTN
jgi:hypothetical protein